MTFLHRLTSIFRRRCLCGEVAVDTCLYEEVTLRMCRSCTLKEMRRGVLLPHPGLILVVVPPRPNPYAHFPAYEIDDSLVTRWNFSDEELEATRLAVARNQTARCGLCGANARGGWISSEAIYSEEYWHGVKAQVPHLERIAEATINVLCAEHLARFMCELIQCMPPLDDGGGVFIPVIGEEENLRVEKKTKDLIYISTIL